MAIEVGDKKRLAFLVGIIVMLGLAGYVWYPRLFSKKPPVRIEPPILIEVSPQRPAPPAAPPARAKAPTPKEPPKVAKEPPKGAAPPAATTQRRYGLEFAPFVTMAEAQEYERRLKEAGLPTLRTVTDVDGSLYTLLVGPFPSAAKASEVMTELRVKPGTPAEGEGGFVFGDGPYILREVIQRAIEIKGKGYGVRIVRAEGKAPLYIIRTAATLDTAQAQKLSSHYRSLGFPNGVVPSR